MGHYTEHQLPESCINCAFFSFCTIVFFHYQCKHLAFLGNMNRKTVMIHEQFLSLHIMHISIHHKNDLCTWIVPLPLSLRLLPKMLKMYTPQADTIWWCIHHNDTPTQTLSYPQSVNQTFSCFTLIKLINLHTGDR